ncbi:MAG: hypothetical protein ACK4ND_06090 [Cytophagaceae bacterium]
MVTGLNYQNALFAEIGIAIKDNGVSGRHPFTRILSVSNEIGHTEQLIVAPKISCWLAGGFAGGLNLLYYSNFKQGALVFRPEVGIGFDRLRIIYGYNIVITNRSSGFASSHLIGINILFNLKKLKEVKEQPRLVYE